LTLVSAPAGFGKTTLLTEWLAARPARPAGERLVAWLSLDRADNNPASFWTYVIAALRTAVAGSAKVRWASCRRPSRPPIETVLTALLNDLGGPLLIVAVFATLLGQHSSVASLAALPVIPVAAWEFSLGVWLVVKGFKPSPITAEMTVVSTPPVYQDVAV